MIYDPPKLIYDNDFGTFRKQEFLLEETETEDHLIQTVRYCTIPAPGVSSVMNSSFISKSKHQKFLAVNGPLAGQKLIPAKAKEFGYLAYNCSVAAKWSKGWPRTVLIHSTGRAENFLLNFLLKSVDTGPATC